MFETINQNINRCIMFTPEEMATFNDLLQPRRVKRKEYLLREGEISNVEAYIVKGCFRSFYIDENGNEVILQFGIEDWWIGDLTSFHERTPSLLYIEALEDSEILTLNPTSKEQLYDKIPKFDRVFRLMLQKRLNVLEKRLIRTISFTAEDRYIEFIKQYPQIVQRVPQHYIASYLGMTPEFLSKIRRRLATRKV